VDEEDGQVTFVGNRTECALLMLLRKWGVSYKEVQDAHHASLYKVRTLPLCSTREDETSQATRFICTPTCAAYWSSCTAWSSASPASCSL
jgi:hypothetical protein